VTATQRGQFTIFFKKLCYLLTHCTLLGPRRKPVTIRRVDDEDDVINVDVSSQTHQHRTTSNTNAHQNGSASSEGDENAEDDISESDDDLSGLNSASLQKKISSEVKSLVFLFISI
jgi:hypothetical protein